MLSRLRSSRRSCGPSRRGAALARLLLASAAVLSLSACGSWWRPYTVEVQQGNFLDQTTVGKLQRGMTPEQVRFLLGSPLVSDAFHAERWDYVYWRRKSSTTTYEIRRLSVLFKDNHLDRVEGDVVPADVLTRREPGADEPAGQAGDEPHQ